MSKYNITITLPEVNTDDLDGLETLCEMMTEVCETVLRKCEWKTVRNFGRVDYEMEEVKEE